MMEEMKYIDEPDFDAGNVISQVETLRHRYAGVGTLSGRTLFRARPSPPPHIYKYTSVANAKLILRDLSLRYTQSEILDDIFEEAPCKEELIRVMPEFEDGPTLVIDVADPEEQTCHV